MGDEFIHVAREENYAVITITRASKRNAMNRQARDELRRAIRGVSSETAAVILTAEGPSFCAGIDLKEQLSDRENGIHSSNEEWRDVNLAIRSHPAIFIAAVNGFALGGGMTLINVCDLAIASDDARLGMPEIGFATYPGLAGPSTQLSLSRKRAAWMILTGARLDGRTAEAWGLVNKSVPAEQLMSEAHDLAKLVAGFDPVALAACKRASDIIPHQIADWKQAFDYGDLANSRIRETSGAQDRGLGNFREGRKNAGQGR